MGSRVPRVEDLRHLTGGSRFGADVDSEGQLHARMVRSEVAFGKLQSIDASDGPGDAGRRRRVHG